MPAQYDPEFLLAAQPMLEMRANMGAIPVHDVSTRRSRFDAIFAEFLAALPTPPDVETQDINIQSYDGATIFVRHYSKKETQNSAPPTSAICHFHGGGMILGSVNDLGAMNAAHVSTNGVPIFSVEYRLAPEFPDPTPVEDCYAGLVWLSKNAAKFNVDPARIAVMGESAGGGLAAGVALMARDRGFSPKLAKQILIYPQIDDRSLVPEEGIKDLVGFNWDDNKTTWSALLGEGHENREDVSPYAAPARAKNVENLPPTYVDVGGLDVFWKEDMQYAMGIAATGTNVEFHLRPGLPHGWEGPARDIGATKRSMADRLRAMTSF